MGRAQMDHNSIASQSQAPIDVQSKISRFFSLFKIATLIHRCRVRKHHSHSVCSLSKAIFTQPFIGKNFFRGSVINSELPFGKDAAYQLLKGETFNRRRLVCLRFSTGLPTKNAGAGCNPCCLRNDCSGRHLQRSSAAVGASA